MEFILTILFGPFVTLMIIGVMAAAISGQPSDKVVEMMLKAYLSFLRTVFGLIAFSLKLALDEHSDSCVEDRRPSFKDQGRQRNSANQRVQIKILDE